MPVAILRALGTEKALYSVSMICRCRGRVASALVGGLAGDLPEQRCLLETRELVIALMRGVPTTLHLFHPAQSRVWLQREFN